MGFWAWTAGNWFTLLQSLGIIAGLVFTAVSFQTDTRSRRTAHLFTVVEHFRDIWSALYERPGLARVISDSANIEAVPITPEEELLVRMLIFHLATVFRSQNERLLQRFEGLEDDVRWFFSLPVPRSVWQDKKRWQDRDFVQFVEKCLTGTGAD